MKKISTLLAVVAALALPGVAMGQGSGADEYSEDIPGGGGNQPSNQNDNGGTSGGSAIPSGTQADLAAQGDDGAAAANLAQETGPSGNGNGGKSNGAGSGDGAGGTGSGGDVNLTPADSDSSGSGIGDVVADLAGGSDDGMGLLLPIILGSVLVAAVAFVLIRRGGGSPGSA